MTEARFRRIALGMKEAVEASHMGHPDFRVNGRIFATLRGDGKRGMVVLPPDEQARFIKESAAAFAPEAGAWGRQGCTSVILKDAGEELVGEAMTIAWRLAASKKPVKARSKKGTKR